MAGDNAVPASAAARAITRRSHTTTGSTAATTSARASARTRISGPIPVGSPMTTASRGFTRLLLPGGLDVGAKARFQGLRALGRDGLVVDVGDLTVEVRADAPGELHGQLGRRARRPLDLVLRRHRKQAAFHEHSL